MHMMDRLRLILVYPEHIRRTEQYLPLTIRQIHLRLQLALPHLEFGRELSQELQVEPLMVGDLFLNSVYLQATPIWFR